MTDWLALLREYITHGKPIEATDTHLQLGDQSVPLDAETDYKSQQETGALRCFFFTLFGIPFVTNTHFSLNEYLKSP